MPESEKPCMGKMGRLTGRVVIVEDEPGIQRFLTKLIRASGAESETASSGKEILERLPFNPNVILTILDLNLPDMSGVQVLSKIRSSHPALPVLLSSGHDESIVAEELSADPNLHFLQKPYQIACFWDSLEKALGTRP